MIAVFAEQTGIEKLEEFDELSAAMAISDESVDLAGEQINPSQQAERTMALVLMITSQSRHAPAAHGRQIRCGRPMPWIPGFSS